MVRSNAMLGVLLTLNAALAQSPEDLAQQTFGQVPADYLFLIDTSQNLMPQAEALRKPLADFVRHLPAQDRIGIVAVHTRPTAMVNMEVIKDSTREALATRIETMTMPSAKETDLGAGLSTAADILGRSDAAKVAFMVMISDWCHDPSVQSRYDSGGRGCRTIRDVDELSGYFHRSIANTLFNVQYFTVRPSENEKPVEKPGEKPTVKPAVYTPIEIQKVAGIGTVSDDAIAWFTQLPSQWTRWRYGPVAQAKQNALQLSLASEGLLTAENDAIGLRLNVQPSVAGELRNINVQGGTLQGEPTLALENNAVIHVQVPLPAAGFAILPSTDRRNVDLHVSATLRLLPEEAWQAVGLKAEMPEQTWTVQVPAEQAVGDARVLMGGVGLLVVGGLGAAFGLRRARRAPLGGHFWWRRGGETRLQLEIERLQEAPIVVMPNGTVNIGGSKDAVFIIMRTGAKTAQVRVLRDGVEINSKPVAKGVYTVLPGATSFRFGEYRLSWE